MKSTIYTTTAIVIATLAAFASGQDGLPDDVRRLLPQADPPMATAEADAAKSSEQAADSNDDTVDQQYSRALLRYENIADQTRGLNEKWHAELTERLERVESFLKSLEEQTPPEDAAKTTTPSGSRHTVHRIPAVAEESTIDVTSVPAPVVVPKSTKPETSEPAEATSAVAEVDIIRRRAEQLEALAVWCENLAGELRLTAKQLRDGK